MDLISQNRRIILIKYQNNTRFIEKIKITYLMVKIVLLLYLIIIWESI